MLPTPDTGSLDHADDSNPLDAVDHLVYATRDLDATVAELERTLGVRASIGGQHQGLGTRNALLALGARQYLEVIGPDPSQPAPDGPRWFRLDEIEQPRLVTWAARGHDLKTLHARAAHAGLTLGEVRSAQRVRPDGVMLAWQLTSPFTVLADGLVPFFIDWGQSPHPADTASRGLTLTALRAETQHPEQLARAFGVLALAIPVHHGADNTLVATITGPRGTVELR